MLIISFRKNFWSSTAAAARDAVADIAVDDDFAETPVSEEDFRSSIKDRRLLLLVHGYRNSRTDVLEAYTQIERTLREREIVGTGPRAYADVIGITWPGGIFRVTYAIAKMRANAIADSVFARLKMIVAEAKAVDVMTHSLGARVILKALQNAPDNSEVVRHLFLTAPAVDDESIEEGEKFYHSTQTCESVFVMHSENDPVLKRLFIIPLFGDSDRALGYKGPEHRDKVAGNVRLADCARIVNEHGDYRKRGEIYTYIKKALNGQPLPDVLEAEEGFVPGTF